MSELFSSSREVITVVSSLYAFAFVDLAKKSRFYLSVHTDRQTEQKKCLFYPILPNFCGAQSILLSICLS